MLRSARLQAIVLVSVGALLGYIEAVKQQIQSAIEAHRGR